jgi:hypothetical protein
MHFGLSRYIENRMAKYSGVDETRDHIAKNQRTNKD